MAGTSGFQFDEPREILLGYPNPLGIWSIVCCSSLLTKPDFWSRSSGRVLYHEQVTPLVPCWSTDPSTPILCVDRAGSLSESFAEVSMRQLVPIPTESRQRLKKDDFKDFGYQFVSVKLKDGRVFAQAVASEGCLIQVKGFREIPFVETDIESVDPDGEPWNFRRRAVRTRTPPRK
jgi:hypothetical protein